jgi:hypothetical protein
MPLVTILLAATGCSSSDSAPAGVSADAALSGLAVSGGSLSPAFASEVVTYAVTVSSSTSTFQVTPTARSSKVYAIQVKQGSGAFTTIASGSASPVYAAPAAGTTSYVMVRVIAEDQVHTAAYSIAVNRERALFTNADLASLSLSGASLSPTFVASQTTYTATVPYGTTSATLTAAAAESHATLQLKQDAGSFAALTSGTPSGALTIPAYPGTTTLTVRDTAESGATKDYVVTVSQAAPATDDTLSALAVSGASLTPTFAPGTLPYAATLAFGTSTFTVTATANESHATLQLRQDSGAWAPLASGTASAALTAPAAGGATTVITIRVTAQSGAFQDYVVTVDETATLSTDASLSALTVAGTTLSPSFTTGNGGPYAAVLPNPTTSFTVTPTTTEAHATVTVQQDAGTALPVASGAASQSLTAPAGDGATTTTITIVVTPQDTTAATRTYTISVTQAAPSTNASLDALVVSSTTISPTFASGTTSYAAVLPYDALTFTVTPTVQEPHATVQVQQDAGGWVSAATPLAAPAADATTTTTVTVRVTAQSGAQQDYTVNVTRAGPPAEVVVSFPLAGDPNAVPTGAISGLQTYIDAAAGGATGGLNAPQYKDLLTISGTTPGTVVYYGTSTAVPAPAGITVQRFTAAQPTWGAELTYNENRWVEFAVSTSATKTLTVDAVNVWVGSSGGTKTLWNVLYSTNPDFSGAQELAPLELLDTTGEIQNALLERRSTPTIVVPPGATLRVRFYPWLTAAGSTKYLMLRSFTVHGWVQ